ncbi:hypothetical protein Bca4012_070505 [Brassica carinata]
MDTSKMSNNTRGNIQESNKTELKLSRENSKKVKKLKHAYIKFYREIIDLQNYSFSNAKAFSKILKKYEKIASRDARNPYMKVVDSSYLGSSDDVRVFEPIGKVSSPSPLFCFYLLWILCYDDRSCDSQSVLKRTS